MYLSFRRTTQLLKAFAGSSERVSSVPLRKLATAAPAPAAAAAAPVSKHMNQQRTRHAASMDSVRKRIVEAKNAKLARKENEDESDDRLIAQAYKEIQEETIAERLGINVEHYRNRLRKQERERKFLEYKIRKMKNVNPAGASREMARLDQLNSAASAEKKGINPVEKKKPAPPPIEEEEEEDEDDEEGEEDEEGDEEDEEGEEGEEEDDEEGEFEDEELEEDEFEEGDEEEEGEEEETPPKKSPPKKK